MKYKKDVPGSEDLVNRLSQIADRINQTDMEMQEIREEIRADKKKTAKASEEENLNRRL